VAEGVKVKILNNSGEEATHGEVGRIFIGYATPSEGHTDGDTKEIIDGLLSSGDVGYFDEKGLLYLTGREDQMVASGGQKVSLAEVENVLIGYPDVVEATALGVADPDWGERLRVVVVKRRESNIDEDTVKRYVREHLGNDELPFEVMFLDQLPRSRSGMISRTELETYGRTTPRSTGGELP
jgi:acyl-CoA synthetase (AMP-forming)/AMP-acid ligase II